MRSILRVISVALVLGAPVLAHAGDSDDTVFLKNGGRVRGTVLIEDPAKGVTIKLADGTSRTVPAAEVKNVEYAPVGGAPAPAPVAAPAPAAAPAAAPVAVAPAPVAAAPAAAPVYAPAPPPPAEPTYHRRTGMLVTGIILMGSGAVLGAVGAGVAISGDNSDYYGHDDKDKQALGAAIGVTGGIAFVTGLPFFIIGMIKVKDEPNTGAITLVPGRVAMAPVVTHNTWGLTLSGNL